MPRLYLTAGAVLIALFAGIIGFVVGSETQRSAVATIEKRVTDSERTNSELTKRIKQLEDERAAMIDPADIIDANKEITTSYTESQSEVAALKKELAELKAKTATMIQKPIAPKSIPEKQDVDGYQFVSCSIFRTREGCLFRGRVINLTGQSAKYASFDVSLFDSAGDLIDVVLLPVSNLDSLASRDFSEEWRSTEGRDYSKAAKFTIAHDFSTRD